MGRCRYVGTTRHPLISETIPKVYGGVPVRSYTPVESAGFAEGLSFTLDCVPSLKRYLNLDNGRFGGINGICIKLESEIFTRSFADARFRTLMLQPTSGLHRCISDRLRYDEPEKRFRVYQVSIAHSQVPTP